MPIKKPKTIATNTTKSGPPNGITQLFSRDMFLYNYYNVFDRLPIDINSRDKIKR